MDQFADRRRLFQNQPERFCSDLHRVLKTGTKADIFATLQDTTHDLKCTYGNGDSVYHVILRNDKLKEDEIIAISEIFRKRSVSPNFRNRERNAKAPVHYAIENRMKNVTDFFIRCRNPKAAKSSNTLTKFFVENEGDRFWRQARSSYSGVRLWDSEPLEIESVSFLEWLIAREPDFDRKKNRGISSVGAAIQGNLQHLLPALLSRNADPATEQASCLYGLLCRNNEERLFISQVIYCASQSKLWYSLYTSRYSAKIVKILLDKGAAIKDYWLKYVPLAITGTERINVIKLLIDFFPPDCDESDATSLLHQLMNYPCEDLTDSEVDCYRQILSYLVAKGADVNDKDEKREMNSIQLAVAIKNECAVVWLSDIGANFDVLTKTGGNLLHLLAADHPLYPVQISDNVQEALFNLLLGKGCEVNAKDSKGKSPLHLAAVEKKVVLARKLIEHDADVNCRDENGQTPLHYAVAMSATSTEFLLENEADVPAKETKVLKLLLENDANVHAKDTKGQNALWLAATASTRGLKICWSKILLEHGAQWDTPNCKEEELESAARYIDSVTVKELLSYGIDISASRFSIYYNSGVQTLFEQHGIALKAAKLGYSGRCGSSSRSDDEYLRYFWREYLRYFSEECLREVDQLKDTFVDSRTSLYRLLHMDFDEKCLHMNNEKLKDIVDCPKLEERFPKYATLILASYREAFRKRSLLEPAKEAWLKLTEIDLPDICVQRILSYLSNADLLNMIER